mmetsp:Transcript_16664/g.30256  ORF Transcript_16664/g.30256 Transcript_16664/m.30256 type:complete len:210 (+) Transcript_16664:711-1340(+)
MAWALRLMARVHTLMASCRSIMAVPPVRSGLRVVFQVGSSVRIRSLSGSSPLLTSRATLTMAASVSATREAMGAPTMPILQATIRRGSRASLTTPEARVTFMGVRVSRAPRKAAKLAALTSMGTRQAAFHRRYESACTATAVLASPPPPMAKRSTAAGSMQQTYTVARAPRMTQRPNVSPMDLRASSFLFPPRSAATTGAAMVGTKPRR